MSVDTLKIFDTTCARDLRGLKFISVNYNFDG